MQKLFVRGWSLIQRLKVSSDPWALRLAGEYLPRTFSWRTHWATKLICETRVFFFVLETHFEIYGPVARTRYTFTQRRNYTRQRGSAWLKKRQKNWLLCSSNFLSIFRQVWLLSANFYSRSFDATCMNLKELQWGMSNRLVLCLYLRKIQKSYFRYVFKFNINEEILFKHSKAFPEKYRAIYKSFVLFWMMVICVLEIINNRITEKLINIIKQRVCWMLFRIINERL